MIAQILFYFIVGALIIGALGFFIALYFMIKQEEEFFKRMQRGG